MRRRTHRGAVRSQPACPGFGTAARHRAPAQLSPRRHLVLSSHLGGLPMHFSFSSEQEEFRGLLRRLLHDRSPTTPARKPLESDAGFDRDAWKKLNQEQGLTAVRIPEAYDGQG